MSQENKEKQPGQQNKILRLFLKAVLITTLVCLAVIGIGIGAYYGFIYQGKPETNLDKNATEDQKKQEEEKEAVSNINQTIAVFGIDKDQTRTDVIFVVNLNSQTKKVKVLALPRDTKVEWTEAQKEKLQEYKGSTVYTSKLNEMTAYGGMDHIRDFTINQIENMLGVKIDNYVIVNIDAFRKIVDTIGGVEVNVPKSIRYDDYAQDLHINLKAGLQHLDGDKAEQLVRFRHYPNGDLDRIQVQQIFLKSFAEKIMSPQTLTKIPQFIPIIFSDLKTDVSLTQIGTYYPFLESFNTKYLTFGTIPGQGKYENGISYFFPDTAAMDAVIKETFFDTQVAGTETAAATDAEEQVKEPVIDKTVTIEVLNATGVKGVAGQAKDTLEKVGYQVERIDNYTQNDLKTTTIYAKDTAKAEQFKAYFKNAEVQLNNTIDYDVQIVIGSDSIDTANQ